MMHRLFCVVAGVFGFLAILCGPVWAADDKPAAYSEFTKGLTPQRGLFTLWRKSGKVYIELQKAQLDRDFIQTAEPASGLGGYGITPGLPYLQFARVIRFSRSDDKVAITWPNTSFVAGTPEGNKAISENFAPSVLALTPVAAEDTASGAVIIDASPFLGDVIDMTDALRFATGSDDKPGSAYRLDSDRSYFGTSKAFPENVIIEADQTYVSAQPISTNGSLTLDNVPDPRAVQLRIKYNIVQPPAANSYMPRLADDRVGYYPNILLDYTKDRVQERQLRYILRWNLARHPMTYYISNTVPLEYRAPIREALLQWNHAFARIGYPHAVQVLDQPADPQWDSDDIRYNTVHWLTESNNGGFAQAGLVFDPRTGELIKTSIVIDADLMYLGNLEGEYLTGPVAGRSGFAREEATYGREAHANAMFGLWALRSIAGSSMRYIPPNYAHDFLESIVLHESGHTWGLQHNFIASAAYSPRQLESRAFTSKYGSANSVMEYTPVNVWPKGTPKGQYFQLVLGPYDYYAIHWGYAPVRGARTPQDEVPTLRRWASVWSNPLYRFANDEDTQWTNGHAVDPRVFKFDLSNDNLTWCNGQLKIADQLMSSVGTRFREYEDTHESQRTAFQYALTPMYVCTRVAVDYIGGEYLSRNHIGDPHSQTPISPVARSQSQRAFSMLDRYVFSEKAGQYSPQLLRQLIYTEWVTDFTQAPWQYDPPLRHDEPVATIFEERQQYVISRMMNPVVLQRIDDFSLKYKPGSTMNLVDLFTWTHRSVFGDIANGSVAQAGEIHRSLQQWYARKLVQIVHKPEDGTPYDAQSLARADLAQLRDEVARARRNPKLDPMTRAHLDALAGVIAAPVKVVGP